MANTNTNAQPRRVCVYCGSTPCTGEHVVNESVIHEYFGDPMQFIIHYGDLGEKVNKVPYVYDVCAKCNNERLQPYDRAAVRFAAAVKSIQHGQQIPFDGDILGWLIKTHCNILRERRSYKCAINQAIFDCIKKHQPVPKGAYQPFIFSFLNDAKLCDTREGKLPRTWVMNAVNFHDQRVMFSYFRMGHLETYIYLPNDNDYLNFGERIGSVLKQIRRPELLETPWLDIDAALAAGCITITSEEMGQCPPTSA